MLSELPQVAKAFQGPEAFRDGNYRLLPFRFLRFDESRYLLTNLAGEFLYLAPDELRALVKGTLPGSSPGFADLKSKHFIYDGVSDVALSLLATKYRSKQAYLRSLTSLHIFVVSLRCDHSCPYCQVSRVSQDREAFDMSVATADKSIDLMFKSPSRGLKVEFQGGESLLNFDLIEHVVRTVKERNDGKYVEFVVATNLSPLTDEMLTFCREHGVQLSTSLDGPADLHNRNRPRPGNDSHQRAVDGIRRVRDSLGVDSVSALMTTTRASLERPTDIVDEYLAQGFHSIFLRPLSPFGFAVRSAKKIGYETDLFIEFYRKGLDYIIELNKKGIPFKEYYASLILTKMLTPYATGFVDLQSPSGLGLSVLVYNYDGYVYASDEARMIAENRDYAFRLGNVHEDTYEDIFVKSGLLETVHETMAEGTPGCVDCAYLPWCGTDPVYHHATQGDAMGVRPKSGYWRRNMGVFRAVLEALERDTETERIMRGWVSP